MFAPLEEKQIIKLNHQLSHDITIGLGAMVVIEEIVSKNRNLAAEALSPLWDRFHGSSVQIQGDILHVFGEIGDPRSVSWLERVLSGNFDREVKEAAREAAEKISNS